MTSAFVTPVHGHGSWSPSPSPFHPGIRPSRGLPHLNSHVHQPAIRHCPHKGQGGQGPIIRVAQITLMHYLTSGWSDLCGMLRAPTFSRAFPSCHNIGCHPYHSAGPAAARLLLAHLRLARLRDGLANSATSEAPSYAPEMRKRPNLTMFDQPLSAVFCSAFSHPPLQSRFERVSIL